MKVYDPLAKKKAVQIEALLSYCITNNLKLSIDSSKVEIIAEHKSYKAVVTGDRFRDGQVVYRLLKEVKGVLKAV